MVDIWLVKSTSKRSCFHPFFHIIFYMECVFPFLSFISLCTSYDPFGQAANQQDQQAAADVPLVMTSQPSPIVSVHGNEIVGCVIVLDTCSNRVAVFRVFTVTERTTIVESCAFISSYICTPAVSYNHGGYC